MAISTNLFRVDFRNLIAYKKIDMPSCNLFAFEILQSVADTISKLINRLISKIIITRAFGTRVIIVHFVDATLLFVR